MTDWPDGSSKAVYVPPPLEAAPVDGTELRARLAAARVRQGLTANDEVLSEIMSGGYASDPERTGIYTASEEQDIRRDNERVEAARAVLNDAEDVFGGLEVRWHGGLRAILVRLTGDIERYRRALSEAIEPGRVLVEPASFTEAELKRRGAEVRAQFERLASEGVFITRSGVGREGFVIEYIAADSVRAARIMQDRFGDFATIRYRGASNITFSAFPFGSWLAEEDRLHVFYGSPRNGERPAGCQAIEADTAVVVALTIQDWRGAKTLVGGFQPAHATVRLERPLGTRVVIDDAHNRARPHWTAA